MRLTDEQGKEYEFEYAGKDYAGDQRGILKPVDSWPKRMWHIRNDGMIVWVDCSAAPPPSAFQPTGLYNTKQEAEYAAERIRSLQEAKVHSIDPGGRSDNPSELWVTLRIPEKYLKAWQEKQDE